MMENATLSKLLLKKTLKSPNKKAIGWISNGDLQYFSNSEYLDKIKIFFYGLKELGLNPNDKFAILSQTNKEWHLFDMASMCARGAVAPIYPTYLSHEVEYILNHSESKILVIENDGQLKKIIEHQDKLNNLSAIISLNEIAKELEEKISKKISFYSFDKFQELGIKRQKENPKEFEASIESSSPDDIASIIYTSGTTGDPKGALIKQRAICQMLFNVYASMKNHLLPTDRTLVFLPLSHVLGRCDSILPLVFEYESIYAESIDKVVDNLAIAKPTVLVAVPRIFEKVYSKVLEKIEQESELKKKVFQWALKVSNEYYEKINQDKSPSPYLIIQKNLAYKLVFEKIYNRFGGRIRFLVSGGAPLSPEIIIFLQNANLSVLEGYGLTETIAPCCLNPVVRQIPGTIGLPLGDVQIKFAEDGEIMIKSTALFSEYYKNPEATKESFKDGWFLSGDIGELNGEGYIRITDRKKDIIITSAGKNVAPQKIENILKLQKHISNAMIVGDKRKFLTAIISIDKEALSDRASELGLNKDDNYETYAKNQNVYDLIESEIANVNKELASYESIKGFFIAQSDFTIDNGQLTPSLKLKKKVILNAYSQEVDALYAKLETKG